MNSTELSTKATIICAALFAIHTPTHAAEVDAARSVMTWKGSKVSGDTHHGRITASSSSLEVRDGQIVGGEVVLDMKTITVEDLQGKWRDKLLGHIKSADFFDVGKFPTATLKIEKVENGKAFGRLRVKDVSQPISFSVKRAGNKYVGSAFFDRTKFGVTYGSGSFFKNLGDKLIHDVVEVEFAIVVKDD